MMMMMMTMTMDRPQFADFIAEQPTVKRRKEKKIKLL